MSNQKTETTLTKAQKLELILDTFAKNIVYNVEKFNQTQDAISFTRNELIALLKVSASIRRGDKRI